MDVDPALAKLLLEKLISFAQAAALFPPARQSRPVSPSCVWRWHRVGVRLNNKQVVRLEAVRVAGRHLTSVEAVHRFIAAQQPETSSAKHIVDEKVSGERTSTRRRRDSENALRNLNARHHGARRQGGTA